MDNSRSENSVGPEDFLQCRHCKREMIPDSMRIHQRKCNSITPQKPSKRKPKPKRKPVHNQEAKPQKPDYNKFISEKQVAQEDYDTYNRNSKIREEPRTDTKKRNRDSQRQQPVDNSRRQNNDYESNKKYTENKPNTKQKTSGKKSRNNNPPSNYRSRKEVNKRNENSKNKPNRSKRDFNPLEELSRNPNKGGPDPFAGIDPFGGKNENTFNPIAAKLKPCRVCNRTFAEERLQKHQLACKKASKKPKKVKIFHKKITAKEKKKMKKPGRAGKWKTQHEEFIKQMQYMRKLNKVEAEGGDIRELAPMPSTENPDLIPCKFCGRRFREAAHERHQGICERVFGGKKAVAKPKKLTGKDARPGAMKKAKYGSKRKKY